MNQSISNVL